MIQRNQPTVLVIEDTESKRYAMIKPLERAGFETWSAQSAAEGLRIALKRPDLIVLDVKLPDGLGFDVCRTLKGNPLTADIPVLHVSATYTDTKDKVYGLDGGADGYLVEPVSSEEFLAHVRVLLRLKEAQDALRGSEERLRLFIEHAPAAMAMFDRNLQYIAASRRWLEEHQLEDRVAGRAYDDAVSHLPKWWKENLRKSLAGEVLRGDADAFMAPDGSVKWIKWEVRPWRQNTGEVGGLLIAVENITDRRRAEQALHQQLELTRTITNNSTVALLMLDGRGYCTFMNPAAEEMLGYTFDEMRAKTFHDMVHHHHPDGRPFPASECTIQESCSGHLDVREHEDIFIRKNGQFFPVLMAASAIQEAGNQAVTVIEVKDITDRKQAEATLKITQDELKQHAEKLELTVEERTAKLREAVAELQRFSYGIAHDMRAPLRSMSSFAQILLEEAKGLHPNSQEYCRRIRTAAARLDKLIQDALSYTRSVMEKPKLEPVDLNRLLHELLDTYPNLQPELAEIIVEGELPSVLGNEALLTQCLSNLLGNAVKFVAAGTKPKVRVWAETAGETVKLFIHDNGIGISKPAQQRLFGMFEKLDNQYEGTGIGLAIVRRLVERMGGTVGAESEPGQGSRFWLELKLAPKRSE